MSTTTSPPHPPAYSTTQPPRSTLRVKTDLPLALPAPAFSARFRSNSTNSSSFAPFSPTEPSPLGHHQFSRSMSHAAMSMSSSSGSERGSPQLGTEGGDKGDVTIAVNGLRNMTSPVVSDGTVSLAIDIGKEGGFRIETEEIEEDLTVRRTREALDKSSDEGDTLDLSRRGIENIRDGAVEIFRKGVGKDNKGVWRLALSYNSLRDGSIVDSFACLSRLRYLNLKGNHLSEFPFALTQMAALEILDLSKNRITAFPEEPGRLNQLKVLSLINNKIYALPSYLTSFNSLKVFKVDSNPIEWPPREVLGALIDDGKNSDNLSIASGKSRRDEDLRPWIENMKRWMRQRAAETDKLLARSEEDAEDESRISPSLPVASSQQTIRPMRDDSSARPISPLAPRHFIRSRSATTSADSLLRPASPGLQLPQYDRSASLSSSTPPDSAAISTSSSSHSRNPSDGLPPPPPITAAGHSRGASYTATQRLSANLMAKKSLPDLRQNHAMIIQHRRTERTPVEDRPLGLGINAPGTNFSRSADMAKAPSVGSSTELTLGRKRSAEMFGRSKGGMEAHLAEKRNNQDGPLVDESRNSYFRRLSTLPVSSISKAIPTALLKFVDSIRGILFALSQVHTALRQYLLYAVDDRTASVLSRVMEPAGAYMGHLINALDRFDSMSRRYSPPVQAIRALLENTKESVAVFAKVVAVLRLQMPAIRDNDVRYSRTLLLMVYGSMAEVANSWRSMAPLINEIRPMLATSAARAILGGHKMMPNTSYNGRTPISPIPERGESHSPPSVTRPTVPIGSSPLNNTAETRPRNRRQGGSFSTQDLEKGMLMGSPDPRAEKRHRPSASAQLLLEDQDEESEPEEALAAPARNDIPITPPEVAEPLLARHKPSSSSGSSHGLSLSTGLPVMRKLSVDVRPQTPASATLFDEDLLDVVETATDIAFTVWLKLAEDVGASSPPFSTGHSKAGSSGSMLSISAPADRRPSTISAKTHSELLNLLSHAEQITMALRESMMGLRANPHIIHQTTLSDDAQAFIKIVVRVSELVKIISATHNFPQTVRQCISHLTQATRECAILIQVSSLSSLRPGNATPAPIPSLSARPYSPSHRSRGSGPMSSAEDLSTPVPAGSQPYSAGWKAPTQGQGLRGLQLPRQMALGRSRPGNAGGSIDSKGEYGPPSARGMPRSAQPSQVAF